MPPSTGQKRHRQIPANNSLITNFYQPQKKRQDTKISSNNENQVSFNQFKKEHLQSSKKRGLGETIVDNNNKNNHNTNKKTTERQPLQQIGGLAANKNLNTGLKNKTGQEQRDAWCVYSDPPENDCSDVNDNSNNNNDFATPASRAPFVVFRDSNEQRNKNNNSVEDNRELDKDKHGSLQNTQRQGSAQENIDEGGKRTEENNNNDDQFCVPLAPEKQNTFNFSDDDFSDEEDEHKGFFDDDDDDDDMLITTTKRPNMNALGAISRLQQQREVPEENDLVPQFSIPQFSIPVQSPVFNDPEPSDDDDDDGDNDNDSDKENEDTPLFPALRSSPTTTTSNSNDSNSRNESSSIEKHDSKLDNNENYNDTKNSDKKNQITKVSPDITTAATYNVSSVDSKSISSLEATIPMEPTEQYETHIPYPLPRGTTLLDKFGIEKMRSDTSTSSSGGSTNESVSVQCSKDKTVSGSLVRHSDEDTENFEDDERLLSATVPMDPTEQQYEAHVPYAVPRGTNLLEKLGLQKNDDSEAN